MYCGSCLHDNALAKALIALGHDTLLVPTYTPILTDEASVARDQLFYGGLNVYLQQANPVFRWLPNWLDRFLSSPKLVNWIASRAMGTSAGNLGPLTVSMLKGMDGNQRKEVRRLCKWLNTERPDVVVFSNLLIAGCAPEIKRQLKCPVVVVLQGDDIFYDGLPPPYRERALVELRRLAQQVDRFVVHSRDYGQRMQAMLHFPPERLAIHPLSIDVADFHLPVGLDADQGLATRPPSVGYLARLAPEKGLHLLVDAFIELRRRGVVPTARLAIAGWLGPQHAKYWQEQLDKLAEAGLAGSVDYAGSVDRAGKLKFLQSIDVLCVPTSYQEPKGLFVLEALAAGVPYVQPAHGAFPELHAKHAGGHLFDPESPAELSERLEQVLADLPAARALGAEGRRRVFAHSTTIHEAERMAQLLQQLTQ
ncbi:GDP-mannose-dependent alpha-(1-6)-phosphatidylinositol monomannoside mannosyltransferase [Aureliella helgolandensis]|uniref:GDP-mannose-dependent alpha-(1-6)-phosphatidylinositol monomannoside mannosyltransferase n=2 Tax=Aureliella helgolandensis TaxID=2527968 RepID=A0A518G1F6_9BACT|nr:GDP-mannose-dependent alpha-(1-6)-phosphatidylinositol monomannoside mannosyltransferase [Aureliella helgolandensis]